MQIFVIRELDKNDAGGRSNYTVIFSGTGKDDISKGTSTEAKEGVDYTFTLVKAEGYTYIVTAVMGKDLIAPIVNETDNTYMIPNVTASLKIIIDKIVNQYTVTFNGTGKDDISEGTPTEVKKGADYIFTLVKAEG